jgi:hypothetical protein
MSVAQVSPSLAPSPDNLLLRLASAAALYRLPVYVGCTVVALVITYVLGKDVPWDALDYHVYAGFSAFNDRFAQDYFAAGPQAYLNPYPYAPLYAMLRAGLSSLEIGALQTIFDSVILWLTYELAAAVCPFAAPRTRAALGVCAVALALVNPVLLQQLGSGYADITTAVLVLAGWLLLVTVVRAPRTLPVLVAAVLLGTATAFKLSNAIHALAGAVLLLMVPVPLRGKLRCGIVYALAGSAAFALVAAPWSYRLARAFGNPFFPLFNDIFRSPEFITQPLRLVRFIPASLAEALGRPFAMLDPTPMVHIELRAPDGRYALLVILASALLLQWLWRLRFASRSAAPRTSTGLEPRALAALGCAFALDWVLWLWTSGNSRYFLPASCVAAVLIAMLLPLLAGSRPARWIPVAVAACALQTFNLYMNSTGLRYEALPWDNGPWLRVVLPEKVAAEPALYLSIGANANAYVAAYVSAKAGFVNFTGSYPLGAAGANGARVEALIHRYSPHLRFLAAGDRLYSDLKHEPNVTAVDNVLARFGLRADPGDCATISVYASEPTDTRPAAVTHLVTCRVVPGATEQPPQAAQQAAELVLDRVEAACPQLLQPRPPLTEYRSGGYRRVYLNTDIYVWISRGYVKIWNPVSGGPPIFLGAEADWLRAPQRVICGRRDGRDFARVVAPGSG